MKSLTFERKYILIMLLFFVLTFLSAAIISTLIYTHIINFEFQYTVAVFLNIYNAVSFVLVLAKFLDFKLINNSFRLWRESLIKDIQITSDKSAIFFKKYLSLNKFLVHLIWINIFLLTFYGLFILIIYLLKDVDTTLGSVQSNFHWRLNIKDGLKNSFGNVALFCLINLIILASTMFISALSYVFVKYRINLISGTFSSELTKYETLVKQHTSQIQKYWFYFYVFCVLFLIFIPLTLLLYRIIKKIFTRKKVFKKQDKILLFYFNFKQ
ncbi:MSC_0882 family membrane protein [Mycoplasmopsis citelli]|uniref:MSC_0882 family membrane protein n=1 Tax=Mycoplasmopsis citelli TaxID=171281 RepID=UPI003A843A54